MIWRASALVSPGFKKRKIPRSELLDPPPRRTRWWVWMLLVVMLTGGSLIALSAIAAEPGEASAGELMFRTAGGGHASAIHLGTNVDITITGIVARTTLVQSFKNSTDEWQEAIYVFPLPGEAAVNFMEMRIGDRVITAEIREREAAKKIYERAKREGKKAALTEQERPNLFTQSVANIAPGETVEVTLRYIETARFDGGTFSLRVPMTLTPRYVPGQPGQSERKGTGWGAPTNEVPDAGRITPPMSHAAARGATIDVSLEAGLDLVSITSDYHRIVPERQGDVHDIRLADGRVPMDRDFVLRWTPVASDVPTATFFRESVGGKDYGLLMVLPPRREKARRLPRDVIFVIDTSGSMKGRSIRQARAALERSLRVTLGPQDVFNVIEFDSSYRTLFPESVAASDQALRQASQFVSGLEASGGTEIAAPLRAALESPTQEGMLKHIVFMTDGAVGNESALFGMIDDKLGDARLFTVGIGSAPNSFFMRKAAEFGRGTFTCIGDTSEVGERIDRLLQKLERPVARNLEIDWRGSAPPDVFPRRLPTLYDGEPLLVTAQSEYLTGDALVRAELNGRSWQQRVRLTNSAEESGIGTLWARAKIESLEYKLVRSASDEGEIRSAIVEVALNHQLMSRFTSLVAVESFVSRRPGEAFARSNVPNQMPQGQTMVSIAATATHATLAFWIGLIAIVLVLGVQLSGENGVIARVLTVPLLVVAAVSFGESIHIKAKAVLAQRLIERAWLRTLEQGESQRPWHWADTWPVARLRSSRLSRDLFVLSGVNGGALAFGPGHFAATALPGAAGTSVVAGHRDTHFEFLQHLRVDDRLSVQDMSGDWFTYIVTERLIIDTRDSSVWSVAPTRDEIHLMTCYPFDAVAPGGPLRLIVIAERRRATSA